MTCIQFSSVTQSCPTLCDPMECSMPGLPVHHQLPEFTQTHVHRVSDAIQPSHPLSSPSSPAFNLFQHQGLFQWISSFHQVARVLKFQLQHQSFQWTFRTDQLYVYIYPLPPRPPSLLTPHPTCLGHHRALSWALCAIQHLPTSHLFTHGSVFVCVCVCMYISEREKYQHMCISYWF